MGRGPKPQPPGPGASTENWDEYYRYLRIWEDAGKKKRRRSRNPRTNPNFGNGEVGGDNSWTAPVYGSTEDDEDVTVSFGQDGRDGHTGIASGHVSGSEYYSKGGHDHYGRDGKSHRDSGRYKG